MDIITFPKNRLTTSGLSIWMHGIISLPDATSYDKIIYPTKTILSWHVYTVEILLLRGLVKNNWALPHYI